MPFLYIPIAKGGGGGVRGVEKTPPLKKKFPLLKSTFWTW